MLLPLVSYCAQHKKGITFQTEVSIMSFATTVRMEQVNACERTFCIWVWNPNTSVYNSDGSEW